MKFFATKDHKHILTFLNGETLPATVAGEELTELVADSVEAATEKHVPVVTTSGNKVEVNVGSVDHPMTEAHLIEWVCIETTTGCQLKRLSAVDAPHASFVLAEGEQLVATYAYCNLHGLWKA